MRHYVFSDLGSAAAQEKISLLSIAMAAPAKLARADMFVPAQISKDLASRITTTPAGNDADGKALVRVTVNNYNGLDRLLSGPSTYMHQYCPVIMCSAIKGDPNHSLIIERLKVMEIDYNGPVSRLQPATTESMGAKVTNKKELPFLYTSLYLAYLYRLTKAPLCPATGQTKPVDQCAAFKAAGVFDYQQRFGGGKTRRRRARRASRKALKRRGGSRKH
jgi:hypothetical protein